MKVGLRIKTLRVGAVVVNKDAAAKLGVALRSLAGQVDYIVVVDNASKDHSVESAMRVKADSFRELEVIANAEERGFSAAMAQGAHRLMEVGVACVLTVTNDVRVTPGCVGEMVKAMQADPGCGAVGPRLVDPASGEEEPRRRAKTWHGHPVADAEDWDYLCGAAVLWRTKALEEVGCYRPGWGFYFEDVDLCWRMRRAGWTLHYAEGATVMHPRESQLGRTRKLRYLSRNNLYFAEEHLSRLVLAAAFAMLAAKAAVLALRGEARHVHGIALGVLDYLRGRRGLVLLALLGALLQGCATLGPSQVPGKGLKTPYRRYTSPNSTLLAGDQDPGVTPALEWDPSESPGVAGYALYSGATPRAYTNRVVVGDSLSCEVPAGTLVPVFYAVTAYDAFGVESDFSDEFQYATLAGALVNWQVPPGRSYEVQESTDLKVWRDVSPPYDLTRPAAFYRLKGVP